jgi:hypothetical protein
VNERAGGRGVIELAHPVDRFLRIGARSILTGAIVVFTVALLGGNLPRDPEGGALTNDILVPLQIALLVATCVGLALSFRWMAVAAGTVAFAGTGIAIISALQYESPTPIFVAVAFLVPAVMMWLDWQCRETFGKIAVLAVTTSALFIATWFGTSAVYDHFFGPAHPESNAVELPDTLVKWSWSGAVDTDSFTVTVVLRQPTQSLSLVVTDGQGVEVLRSPAEAIDAADTPMRFVADGLQPGTGYRYVFESEGVADTAHTGRVTTFPEGPASLTLAFGSCARTNSNGAVFDTIRELEPDLYVIAGDLHYRNIDQDDPSLFASAYAEVHDSPAQSLLYRSVPIAYVWDDHDFGPNDSDATSASRPAAWQSYREFVPHYELAEPATGSINQAFSIGRVRVVMIDTRSHRLTDDGVLLGDQQLRWLFEELLAARDSHVLTVLVSPTAWIGPAEQGADHWGGYAGERDRLGKFLDEYRIDNLVLVGGDAHMVAIDDGTNSGYGGDDGFPVLQVAALDRRGSVKGGPYSGGAFPGGGQFGVVEVTDTGGDTIDVELIGLDWKGTTLTSSRTTFTIS